MLAEKIKIAATEFVDELKVAFADRRITFAEVMHLAGQFVRHVSDVIGDVRGLNESDVLREVLDAFDAYVWPPLAAFDLPAVPNFIVEAAVDRGIHFMLTTMVIPVLVDVVFDGKLDQPLLRASAPLGDDETTVVTNGPLARVRNLRGLLAARRES